MGGAANGIPRNPATPYLSKPTTVPFVVWTVGAPAALPVAAVAKATKATVPTPCAMVLNGQVVTEVDNQSHSGVVSAHWCLVNMMAGDSKRYVRVSMHDTC